MKTTEDIGLERGVMGTTYGKTTTNQECKNNEGVDLKNGLEDKNIGKMDVPTVILENENDLKSETVTPSVGEPENYVMKCEPNEVGMCGVHNCKMRQIKIPTKKWRDRGKGRGFGYVKVMVTKFICSEKLKA